MGNLTHSDSITQTDPQTIFKGEQMQNPNNELLTEVLEDKVLHSRMLDENNIVMDVVGRGSVKMNIYELMHLCKNWALCEDENYNFYIFDVRLHADCCTVWVTESPSDNPFTVFQEKTEPETIFRACEKITEIRKEKKKELE